MNDSTRYKIYCPASQDYNNPAGTWHFSDTYDKIKLGIEYVVDEFAKHVDVTSNIPLTALDITLTDVQENAVYNYTVKVLTKKDYYLSLVHKEKMVVPKSEPLKLISQTEESTGLF